MMRIKPLKTILFKCLILWMLAEAIPVSGGTFTAIREQKDSVPETQILFNGRLWRNLYNKVKGDQFLFTREFLPGTVSMTGKVFTNLVIRYDIFNDELTIPFSRIALQINKEMVDSFSITFQGIKYQFDRFADDSLKVVKGYLQVLYKGKCALYIKYKKEIEPLAVDKIYDKFYQVDKIWFVRDGKAFPISGKKDIMNIMEDQKAATRDYVKKNKLKMSKSNPESFIPLVRFYDSLLH